MSCAFRFCRYIGSLQGLWHGWVNCAFQVTALSVQQRLFFQVSAFNHFSLKYTAPHLCFLCPTLVFVTRATVFACPQLVKNIPSTQPRTHEVRELSQSLVWSGLERDRSSSDSPSISGATSLASAFASLQPSCKLWRPTREKFMTTSNVTLRSPFDMLQPVGPASNL